jgi:hypothetical protein
MAGPGTADGARAASSGTPDETARTPARWLSEGAGVAGPDVGAVAIPRATGWSNETRLLRAQGS